MRSFEDFAEHCVDDIMEGLFDIIDDLDIPRNVKNQLRDIISDNSDDIIEARFESQVGEYKDRAYDEYKDERN